MRHYGRVYLQRIDCIVAKDLCRKSKGFDAAARLLATPRLIARWRCRCQGRRSRTSGSSAGARRTRRMLATESKESSEEDHLLLQRLLLLLLLLRLRASLLRMLLLLLCLLMRVRGVGRRTSDAKRAIRWMHVIPATDSVMVAVPELRRGIRGSGDDCWATACPGVPIRTIIARGATTSVEHATKHTDYCLSTER